METSNFAAVLIGDTTSPVYARLKDELTARTSVLRNAGESFHVFTQDDVATLSPDTRAVAVVLCRAGMPNIEEKAIEECLARTLPIFPVLQDLKMFGDLAPAAIAAYNGYELADIDDTGELAGLILEALGLLRAKRKIFISYARVDSAPIAQQLREAFTARWYSVFLDTITIRPGTAFQDELLQELADSDVMVLLNSPSIERRPYVQKEIAFADRAGLGGVQVTWPDVDPLGEGAFFQPIKLDNHLAQIGTNSPTALTSAGVTEVLRTVAGLRSALQQQREVDLIRPVDAYAQSKQWYVVSHPGRYIELHDGDKRRIRLDLALGVPTSWDLERVFQNSQSNAAKGRLAYDPLGITNNMIDHLNFLGARLGLEYLDPRGALQWTVIP